MAQVTKNIVSDTDPANLLSGERMSHLFGMKFFYAETFDRVDEMCQVDGMCQWESLTRLVASTNLRCLAEDSTSRVADCWSA